MYIGKILSYIFIVVSCICFTACSGLNKETISYNISKYSVDVVCNYDSFISDGLPDGTDTKNIFKSIQSSVVSGLSERGLTNNVNSNNSKYVVKYNITYFAHKWKGLHVKYIINYSVQLINSNTGIIVASDQNDHMDEDLLTVIDRASNYIVKFASNNITGSN